jgi:hypothetical protein
MTIVFGRPDELKLEPGRISRFYREHWPKHSPLADEELYDYLYRQPTEHNVEAEASTVALDTRSGTIVAAMAARARAFFLPDGRRLNGVEMSTWLVHPEMRSGGNGVKVLTSLRDRADFCVGASITPEARNLYLRLGFSWQPALPRFVYAPDWSRLARLVRDPIFAQRVANARVSAEVASVSLKAVDLAAADSFDDMRGAAAFDRRPPALQWRFARNPFFTYRAVRIEAGGLATLVVFRLEAVGELTVLRVVDIVGDLSALPLVPMGLQSLCSSEKADAVDCFCSHVAARDAFAGAGWFVLPDDESVMDFPHLLAPPSPRSPNSFSTVHWVHPRFREALPGSALFITKQDCDMDRLSTLPNG